MLKNKLRKQIFKITAYILFVGLSIFIIVLFLFISSESSDKTALLEVSLDKTEQLRLEFIKKLRSASNDSAYADEELEKVFINYSSKIGVDGILFSMRDFFIAPKRCHFIGHSLGKFIYDSSASISDAINTCSNTCTSGCMHGAVETALTIKQDKHLELKDVQARVPEFCYSDKFVNNGTISSCSHAIGHAFSQVTNYNISLSLENCQLFKDKTIAYYCAAGVYMDYAFDFEMGPGLHPCDIEAYPSMCFYYLFPSWYVQAKENGEDIDNMKDKCSRLNGLHKFGCFYGLGRVASAEKLDFAAVCDQNDFESKQMCVEGFIRYWGTWASDSEVLNACSVFEKEIEEKCIEAGAQDLYGIDRDWSLYY